jgi:hypothetical protein
MRWLRSRTARTEPRSQPGSATASARAAIAKIERDLRYVADFELVAIARALKVSPLRLPQRGPS